MKKIILIFIAIIGLSGTTLPMELIKQPLRKLSHMLIVRAIGLGATVTPAAICAQQKGHNYNAVLNNSSINFLNDSDVRMDAVSIVAPALITAFGTRSIVKAIAPRFGKTNTGIMLKGAISFAISDGLFYENKATKKIKALWNKYSYKL